MNYKQLYKIKDINGDGNPEVLISHYNEGNDNLSEPDYSITLTKNEKDGKFYNINSQEDINRDGERDDDDELIESYYEIAANLVSAMATLSVIVQSKVFDSILLLFADPESEDVSILHFKEENPDIKNPDHTVVVVFNITTKRYNAVRDLIDADGKTDAAKGGPDVADSTIYRRIATAFSAMQDIPLNLVGGNR